MPQKAFSRTWILIIAAALLAIAGFLVYQQMQTPADEVAPADETADLSSKALATKDWETYRNEEYGFEIKYPPHLQGQKTLLSQAFNSGLEGSIISSFSDGKTDELVLAVSQRSLDEYIVRDNPGGVFYRFNQNENKWISSVRGEITGGEPKLLDAPITAYGYRSGDGKCSWHGTVAPHTNGNIVLEIVYISCVDEGQQPGPLGRIPDLNKILSTFKFLE